MVLLLCACLSGVVVVCVFEWCYGSDCEKLFVEVITEMNMKIFL